ncbi:hypothetical protein EAI_13217, partial [Harpegnathos saltator]
RIDSVRRSVDPPYSGPHRIIRRVTDRVFIIDINGEEKTLN